MDKPGIRHKWALLHLLQKLKGCKSRDYETIAATAYTFSLSASSTSHMMKMLTVDDDQNEQKEKEMGGQTRRGSRMQYNQKQQLLRDVVFVLQGIDGQFIKFDPSIDAYTVVVQTPAADASRDNSNDIMSFLSAPERRLVRLVCEGGYFHQIATLESEITAKSKGSTAAPGGGKSRLTLRGVYLWSIQLVDNLRLMATICDTVEGARGGALISGIGKFLHHGDPNVEAFVRNVLQRSCVPLFRMIAQWMSAAELKDPFHEFFVTARKSVGVDRLWQDRYRLNTNMIPFFIDKKLAHSILSVGKSINFIQNCCRSSGSSNGGGGGGGGLFERMMTRRREQLEVTVSDLRVEGLHKLTFANADKTGWDLLREELEEPATKVFRHNLVLVLKAAIQQSNAQFEDQDVLNRLDQQQQHCGCWLLTDTLTLIYTDNSDNDNISTSICVVVAAPARGACFGSMLVLECAWAKFDKEIEKAKDLDALIDAHERYLSQILNGAMMEGRRWHAKKKKTGVEQKAEGSSGVNQRGGGGGRQQQPAGVTQLEKLSDVVVELNKMFDVILQFVRLQEHVYEAALEDIELTTQSKIRAYRRQQLGRWGQTAAEEVDEEEKRVFRLSEQKSHKVFERLVSIEAVFSSLLAGLRSRLSDKHSSSDAQFLDVRLDFNEFYDEKKRRQEEEIKHKAAK
eukprot:jgi/Bigna1/83357/fgenesh1_pg.106_\